jgi:osmotically-inducible protein OsmY
MSWLSRLFGLEKPPAQTSVQTSVQTPVASPVAQPTQTPQGSTSAAQPQVIPPERMGLSGEYDQSGLAKRVALAFDLDPNLDDIETIYVAQTSGTVVLKGKAPSQDLLNKMVSVAKTVSGATAVETNQVTIG